MISTNDELRLMRARFSRSASSLLSSLLALGAVACGSGGDAVGPEAEPVLDGGADDAKDGDVDPGVDAGADADTDTDADVGDADTEGDADVEADGGVDADADVDDADVDDADVDDADVDDADVDDADVGDADANDADPDADVAPTPARIEVTPDAPSVVEGRTVKLVAKGYDDADDEIDVDVTWSSSDETRATVDDTDLVTTLRPGTVTITATASGKSDAATITITESTAVSIRFEAGTADVPLDGQVQLRAIVEDAEGYELLGRDVVFESEDESIVTVTPDGIATGVEVGEATIKVKLGAIERSLDVRVVLRFAEIVASYRNTCGLTAGGRAWCWGDNTYGQLGIGTKGAQPYDAPQRVGMDPDLSFETLKLGAWFTCALSAEKEVWCWGNNVDTVLGLPYVELLDSSTPRLVPDREYEKLSAMQWAVCGLDTEGFAYCWGSGSIRYELGANVTVDTPTPVAVSAPEGEASPVSFVELRHGDYFSCGLTGTGRLYCWGRNDDYRLGDGTTTHRARSVRPLGDKVVKRFDLGIAFACAVTDDDTTYCWGRNDKGQADPSTAGSNVATPAVRFEATDFVPASFALGADHACALDHEGRAHCWGSNALYQLGRSTSDSPADKGEVEGGLRFTQLTSGHNHVCGLATDGKAYCWGENQYRQLGTGDPDDKPQPTLVKGQ